MLTAPPLSDAWIRQAVIADLQGHIPPDDIIVQELGLDQGSVRADVVRINGALHGYEIKGDRDTLRRLPAQMRAYGAVMERATAVVAERHVERVLQMVPPWWGVTVVHTSDPVLTVVRAAKSNPELLPGTLAMMLWRDEALAELMLRGTGRGISRKSRTFLCGRLAEALTRDELQRVVAARIKQRGDWRAGPSPRPSGARSQSHAR